MLFSLIGHLKSFPIYVITDRSFEVLPDLCSKMAEFLISFNITHTCFLRACFSLDSILIPLVFIPYVAFSTYFTILLILLMQTVFVITLLLGFWQEEKIERPSFPAFKLLMLKTMLKVCKILTRVCSMVFIQVDWYPALCSFLSV